MHKNATNLFPTVFMCSFLIYMNAGNLTLQSFRVYIANLRKVSTRTALNFSLWWIVQILKIISALSLFSVRFVATHNLCYITS
jgi:hypothetical protein